MLRSEKEQIIADVSDRVGRANGMFFTDFVGLTVEEVTELRRDFHKSGIDYQVIKNTLIQKALEQAGGYDKVFSALVGPTAVAFAYEDAAVPAKIIHKFSQKHKKLSLKACLLEKQYYDGSKLEELAKMPSRPEVVAGILGCIQSPLAGVPMVINAVMRDLVSVISEIEKKKAA